MDSTWAVRSAVEFICSELRVKPDDILKDTSTLNFPVILGFLWDSTLTTKDETKNIQIIRTSLQGRREEEIFQTFGLRL